MASPPNCKFEIDDARDDWTYPPEYFDFIHIRSLFGSIEDWPALYKRILKQVPPNILQKGLFVMRINVCRHLKPGGYLEQVEISIEVRILPLHVITVLQNS
jgi:hypothetical protein